MEISYKLPRKGDQFVVSGPYARGHRMRRRGLSGMTLEDAPKELVFEKCRSIHTFGMKFVIRVIFLDSDLKVIGARVVPPRRLVIAPRSTHAIVEQPFR